MITIDMSEIVNAIVESGDLNMEVLNVLAAQLAMQNMLFGVVIALLLSLIVSIIWGRS